MAQLSRAAKAAAILHHTWGVEDYSTALEIYETCEKHSELDLVELLERYNAGMWDQLDHLTYLDWWENVRALAESIDAARAWEAQE